MNWLLLYFYIDRIGHWDHQRKSSFITDDFGNCVDVGTHASWAYGVDWETNNAEL